MTHLKHLVDVSDVNVDNLDRTWRYERRKTPRIKVIARASRTLYQLITMKLYHEKTVLGVDGSVER